MSIPDVRVRFEESWGAEGVTIRKALALVLRKTPKGAWCRRLRYGYHFEREAFKLEIDGREHSVVPHGKEFFVLDGLGARKFHETDQGAWNHYRRRKVHAVSFAERRYNIQKAAAELCADVEEPPKGRELTVNPAWNRALNWDEY